MYPRKGAIAVGSDADITVLDPTRRRTITAADLHETDYTPWEGWTAHAWPCLTMRHAIRRAMGRAPHRPRHHRSPDEAVKESMFFFEKKNQKTFSPWSPARNTNSTEIDKSLFASFSSEKEESCCQIPPSHPSRRVRAPAIPRTVNPPSHRVEPSQKPVHNLPLSKPSPTEKTPP